MGHNYKSTREMENPDVEISRYNRAVSVARTQPVTYAPRLVSATEILKLCLNRSARPVKKAPAWNAMFEEMQVGVWCFIAGRCMYWF